MNKILFALFISMLSFNIDGSACSHSCIKKLKAEIKQNWSLSNDGSYYKSTFEFNQRIYNVYRDCLIGCSKSQIEKLFGKPTKRKQNSFEYLLTAHPVPPNFSEAFLQIEFDENNKLKSAVVLGRGVYISD